MSDGQECSVVYLVGAGPGAADLITLRGYRLLMSCDALVYDHLVAPGLVEECPAAIKVYVGKVAGKHARPQPAINQLLIDFATDPNGPRRIVRLKGGDPFVFGRGGEEVLACTERGIRCEVVPGVTAGTAAPAAVGVPVTHREFTRGVTFITGHAKGQGRLDLPWKALVDSGLTLVFFMGVATLECISDNLVRHGMAPTTPTLVVQEGTMPSQRHVVAPLASITKRVREAGLQSPSIIVVGDVVSLALTQSDCRFLHVASTQE